MYSLNKERVLFQTRPILPKDGKKILLMEKFNLKLFYISTKQSTAQKERNFRAIY